MRKVNNFEDVDKYGYRLDQRKRRGFTHWRVSPGYLSTDSEMSIRTIFRYISSQLMRVLPPRVCQDLR